MDAIASPPAAGLAPELWQLLADNLPHLAWIAQADGDLIWYNKRWYDYTGTTFDEMRGWGWKAVHHPDEVGRVEARFRAALATGEPWEDIFPLRSATGTYRHFLSRAQPLRDDTGLITHWFGTNTDITEQLEAKAEASLAAERLGRTVAIANMFVWESDGATGVTRWGENAAEILGIAPEELPRGEGDGTFFVAPEEKDDLRDRFEAAIARREAHTTLDFAGSDGRQWRAECRLTYAADGSILRVDGATRDISEEAAERRRADFLLLLEERLRMETDATGAKLAAARTIGQEIGASRVAYAEVAGSLPEVSIGEEFLDYGVASIAGVHRIPAAILDRYLEGRPLVSEDFLADPRMEAAQQSPEIASLPFRAFLDVPLLRGGELVAVLSIHDTEPRRWTEEEIAMAVAAAERTWSNVERARAEEKLRLSEAQFRTTAEALPGMLFVTDGQGRNLYVNEYYRAVTGATDEEVIGRGWPAAVHPDDLEAVKQATREAMRTGNPFELDYRVRLRDGSFRWHSTRATAARDASGNLYRWVGISLDIHDRREAEEQARAAAEEIEAIYATAPVGLTVLDTDLRYVRINDRLAEMNGLPAADHIGRSVREIIPDLSDQAEAALRRVLDGEEVWALELSGSTRAHPGVVRTWRENFLPVRNAAGEVVGVAASAEDVTSSKASETALASAEERYRTIFNSAAVGIARVSPEGPFLEINDRFCDILGRSRREVLGGGWQEITHPDDVAADEALVERVRAGEIDSFSLEKRYIAPDGSDIWVNLTVSAERNPDGSVRFFISVVEDIAERKAAEAALRASEERYRTLFESMEQGFCVLELTFDETGKATDLSFVELNPAFTRESGLSPDVLGRPVSEAVPDLERSWFEIYGEVARSGQSCRFVERASSLQRSFEVYAFPTGHPGRNQVAVLFTDISDRIRQEEALRRSEQELRLRLNAIPQMVWSTLPDGYHDFYNDRWYEFTGTPLGSTDGSGWNGMFHPEDQATAWERWNHSLETGTPYEIEYRLRHHSGDYRWVLGRALPIRNDDGEIVRWMGTCTDIDDRIQARRALERSEARLRAIFKAVPVGLVFADAGGRITGSNQVVEGFLRHEVVPSPSTATYADDYVAFHEDGRQVESEEYPLARALAGEERPELECRIRRGDGTLGWLRYVGAPIREENEEITGAVVASIDIDREKRLTQSLGREVERVVAEREAAQEALRQSQKLEAMGQLTGGVAHDFNNLLTPIIGSLDLLQRRQRLDERTGRLVDGALASAEKARVLVQRLLAFARRQPLRPRAVDLGRIVAEMSELIDSTSGPRVRVDVSVPDALPPALADGNQLEMALLNLAVNARDAMPDGGTLTIAVRPEQAAAGKRLGLRPEPHLVLSVSDTGTGMDEATCRRAIEPFFSTKGVGKGTGLGLSMVHGLAAQLGGALDIRSAPGMGTTIELWLPVAGETVAERGGEASEPERHNAGTVLLVDDEELVRSSTASMLSDLGYKVVEAASGEEALAVVEGGLWPDVLITDQLMPGLNGTDLAVRLQAELPVLIVSGYADLESLSPAFAHLSKPFRQAELAAALEKLSQAMTGD